jgi:hypothetical protein
MPPDGFDNIFHWMGMPDSEANAAARAALLAWGLPVPDPADVLRIVCRSH